MNFSDYIGRQEQRSEVLPSIIVERLAATLGVRYERGAALAPTWHWLMFQEWPQPDEIGADGHPCLGGFLPRLEGFPRRMRAGGRLAFSGPLYPEESVTRIRTISGISEKQGASGRMVFVNLHDELTTRNGCVLSEDQELAYLAGSGLAASRTNEAALAQQRLVNVDSVLLFRYSALTGNSHRIHYDGSYARDVENHAALVVHAPLQATWLAGLASEKGPISTFSFRARRPAYVTNAPMSVEIGERADVVLLQTRDRHGTICVEATATRE
jgi:hydroxyacyl-ACP dehydratase HTD2-like protein with hotdog domain